MPSSTNWRTRLIGFAPSAIRIASSRLRPVTRSSIRLATLAHTTSKHQPYDCERNHQHLLHVAGQRFLQRHNSCSAVNITHGMGLTQRGGNAIQIVGGLCHRYSRLGACDHVQKARVAK